MKLLITGGGSGLGRKILEKLNPSIEVHFTYNKSNDSAQKLLELNQNFYSYKCDFTNQDELTVFLEKIKNIDFDILINNYYSGKFLDKHFSKTTSEEFLNVYANNILPVIKISQIILEKFKNKKRGLIISISSKSIKNPPIGTSSYTIVKSVLEQLSRIWSNEYKKFGVISRIISPSFMRTNLTSQIDERMIELFFENHSNVNEIDLISNKIIKIIEGFSR